MKQESYPTGMEDYARIDKYPTEACPDLSRFYTQKLLESGQVLVNGQGMKASYIVVGEDRVKLEVLEATKSEIDAEPMDLDTLYEDQDVILINKPEGMVAHSAAGHCSYTPVNGFMYHRRDRLSDISGIVCLDIAYRIDMDTTGVIVTCKNDMAHGSIAAQLKEYPTAHRCQTIVHGVIAEDEGTMDAPIDRHPAERKKMSINYQNGKDAVAYHGVLNRFRQYAHVECRLEIGRTHQIRVHMASIRYSLLGNTVYRPARCLVSGLCGQTPRAGVLGFIHPRTEKYMEFAAPLPEYFDKLLRTLN